MLEPPARWETNRLVMKPPTRAEAAVMFETYAADPEVSRYMIWRPHRSVEETEQFLRRCEDVWQKRLAFPWSLWLKADGSFAGMLEARVKAHAVDIGYVLAPRLWRRGLMSEAVAGLIEWAMASPGSFASGPSATWTTSRRRGCSRASGCGAKARCGAGWSTRTSAMRRATASATRS